MSLKMIVILGFLFSVMSVVADHFVLWHPDLNPLDNNFLFLSQLPRPEFIFGVWMGILGVIGEVGFLYLLIGKLSKQTKTHKMINIVLFVLVNLGVAYHLMLGYLQDMAIAGIDLNSTLTAYVRPLEAIIGVLFLSLNILWFKLTREPNSPYGQALKYFLPAYVYILGIGLNFIIPSIAQMILLSGLNLAIAILFLLAFITLPKNQLDANSF